MYNQFIANNLVYNKFAARALLFTPTLPPSLRENLISLTFNVSWNGTCCSETHQYDEMNRFACTLVQFLHMISSLAS